MLRKALFTLLLAVLMLVGLTTPASAHSQVDSGWVYVSDGPCTWARTEVSHGNGYGRTKASVAQDFMLSTPFGDYACQSHATQGIRRMATRYIYYKWVGTRWSACRDSGWYYNTKRTHKFEISTTFVRVPCGAGYYATNAGSYSANGNSWDNGGWLFSPYHHFSAAGVRSAFAPAEAAPPLPAWVNPDGTVDLTRMPGTTTVIGVDGNPVVDSAGREITISPQWVPAAAAPPAEILPGTTEESLEVTPSPFTSA